MLLVRVLQISGLLEAYMVVNFKARVISSGAHKLSQTLTLIKKNTKNGKIT
jgi:hypothetical protein